MKSKRHDQSTFDQNSIISIFIIIISLCPTLIVCSMSKSKNEFIEFILPLEIKSPNSNRSIFFTPSSSRKNEVIKFNPVNYGVNHNHHVKRRKDVFRYKSSFEHENRNRLNDQSTDYHPVWPLPSEPVDLEPTIGSKEIVWPEEARKLRRYEFFEEKEDDESPSQKMARARKKMKKKQRRKVYKIEPIHLDDEEDDIDGGHGHHAAPQPNQGDYEPRRIQKGSDRQKVFKKNVRKLYPQKFMAAKDDLRKKKKIPSKRRQLFIVGQ